MNGIVKIKISVRSAYPATDARNQRLFDFLQSQGFELENLNKFDRALSAKSPEVRSNWQAFSHQGEAEDLKNQLRQVGFADKDFQINVEYQRGWGFL